MAQVIELFSGRSRCEQEDGGFRNPSFGTLGQAVEDIIVVTDALEARLLELLDCLAIDEAGIIRDDPHVLLADQIRKYRRVLSESLQRLDRARNLL